MVKKYLNAPEEVITALQAGKIVLDSNKNKYKMINGTVAFYHASRKEWGLNMFITNHDGLYIEENSSLKLEVGKFYRTRRGDKVIVLYINNKTGAANCPVFIAAIGKACSYFVSETGSYYSSGRDTAWDIVAPWKE